MRIKATYIPLPGWEKAVANATAEAPGARAACMSMAQQVETSALATLEAYNMSKRTARLASLVLDGVGLKPVEDFERRKVVAGSTIPVALVYSNSLFSEIVEFGGGPRTPPSFFLTSSGWSRAGGSWEFTGRGKGRGL